MNTSFPTMDEIEQDLSSLSQDPREADLQYCHFFQRVVNKLVDLKNDKSIGYLKRYFQLVQPTRGFGAELRDTGFEDPDIQPLIDTLFFRAIQVYRSGLVMSSAVDFHFRNRYKENRNLLHKMLKKKALRICSIGGRLPSDLVALITVLQSVSREVGLKLDIRVTVIETDEAWKTTCFSVLGCMETFRGHIWKIQFITSNLPDFDDPKVKKAIGEADIVTMVKFYSEFKDMSVDISGVMEKINQMILPGSLLFFLDFSKDSVIDFCGGALGVLQNSQLVYEELCDLHALDPDAVERNFHMYHRKIMKPYYSKYLNVFARVWLKRKPKTLPEVRNPSTQRRPTFILDFSEDPYKGRLNIYAEYWEETSATCTEEKWEAFTTAKEKWKASTSAAERWEVSSPKLTETTCEEDKWEISTTAKGKWKASTYAAEIYEASTPKLTEKDKLISRLETRFSRREKYNPKQSDLSSKTFEIWEKKIKEESLQNGRSRKGTKRFVLRHLDERNILLVQLLSKRKTLETMRRELVKNSAVSRENSNGISEKEWKKYLTEKRNFSAFKLKIYSFTLDKLTRRLEKMHQNTETKKKRFIPTRNLIPITKLKKMCNS